MSYEDRKLSEMGVSFQSGFAFKSSDFSLTGIPVIKIGNIQNKVVSIDPKGNYIEPTTLTEKTKGYLLQNQDVLIAMTGQGSVGRVGKLRLDAGQNALLNQRVGRFICDEVIAHLPYIYYVLTSDVYQEYLFNTGVGSGQPNLSPQLILDTEIPCPSYEEQKAIASVLSSLDDKIDLLHRQNKTLEAMAETLFRQWFIEEAKEDWEEASLGSLFTISSGKGLKREQFRDHGLIPVLGANGEIGRTDQVMFEEFLIYTGRVGTLGKVSIIEGQPVWLSDNTLVFRDIEYFYFTYFQLKAVNYQEYNVGSTQPLIRQSDIKEIAVLLPSDLDMIKRFELQAKDIFGKIQTNTKQIQTLENLRNTLLPKLMSGEVRVQFQTEEVA